MKNFTLIIFSCFSYFALLGQQGTINLQFANATYSENNSLLCMDIQISANTDIEPINIGNSSITINYNINGLSFNSYQSLGFDEYEDCLNGASAWKEHSIDYSSVPGKLHIVLTLDFALTEENTYLACPAVDEEWINISNICFNILDTNTLPNLNFEADNQYLGIPGSITAYFQVANVYGYNELPNSENCIFDIEDIIICPNSNSTIISGPDGFNTYMWNNSEISQDLEVSEIGTYTLTAATSTGCLYTDTVNVSLHPQPNIGISDVSICEDNIPYLLTIPDEFESYQWSNGSNTSSTSIFSGGTYWLRVTDSNGCAYIEHFTITLEAPDSDGNCFTVNTVNAINDDVIFEIFPIFSKNSINVLFPSNCREIEEIYLLNIQGELLRKIRIYDNETVKILTENLKAGMYFLQVKCGNTISTKKFFKI